MSGGPFLLVFLFLSTISCKLIYQLISIDIRSEEHFEVLNSLRRSQNLTIDFLTRPRSKDGHIHVLVAPHEMDAVQQLLISKQVKFHNHTDLLQRFLTSNEAARRAKSTLKKTKGSLKEMDYSTYHTLDEIYAFLKQCNIEYPQYTELVRIGESYEGRDLIAIKIGSNESKPIIWIDAGVHAREWIAPAAAMYFIKELLEGIGENSSYNIVDNYNVYILPMFNPDGYEYSWSTNRLWRKSRSKHKCDFNACCYGVDLDRNFEFDFKSNANPCKSDYTGPEALSEPETKAVAKFLTDHYSQVWLYITLHSFGQYILMPFGARAEKLPNHWPMMTLARHFIQGADMNSRFYFPSKTLDLEFKTGQAIDYAVNTMAIPFAYAVLLRPTDEEYWEFDLPQEQIVPTSKEAFGGLLKMAKVLKHYVAKTEQTTSSFKALPRGGG